MSDRISKGTASKGLQHWALALFASACGASACLSDAEIAPCIRAHSCGGTGSGTGAGAGTGTVGGAANAGTSSHGGSSSTNGGASNDGGVASAGGELAGEAGTGPGGEAGAPNEPCDRCSILPRQLTAPCAGHAYDATLNATGGVAPYAWQLTPALKGWSVAADPEHAGRATLHADSVAAGDTTIAVRAIDARGLDVRVEYHARARDACWFAYTAGDANGHSLALLDPLAEEPQPVTLEHNAGVYDFQFSSNGRYLVYRYGADSEAPHGRHLALVELSSLTEQVLSFQEDAISAYAWSPDSSVLAVAFSGGDKRYLSGARLPAPGSTDSPTMLTATVANVEENLAWVGTDAVAYHAELLPDLAHPGTFLPNPDHFRSPVYARLGVSGFGAEHYAEDSFDPNMWLRPAGSGFWIINSPLSTFFPMSGSAQDSVPHYEATLIAPSGSYSALVDGGMLQLFAAEDGTGSEARASSKPNEACPLPLAWSQQDKVACVADVDNAPGQGSHGEVRFFDLQAGSDVLTMTTLTGFCKDDISKADIGCTASRQGYAYGVNEATGMPRAFSASGRRFAFTRAQGPDTYLYWADLTTDPPALSGSSFVGQSGAPARLAFSPDDTSLALQLGGHFYVKFLNSVDLPTMGLTLEMVDRCTEELPTAPDRYCGNTALDAPFKWAPDSQAVAYRTSGAVQVVDTSQAPSFVNFPMPEPLCEPPLCGGGFEFQPSPQH